MFTTQVFWRLLIVWRSMWFNSFLDEAISQQIARKFGLQWSTLRAKPFRAVLASSVESNTCVAKVMSTNLRHPNRRSEYILNVLKYNSKSYYQLQKYESQSFWIIRCDYVEKHISAQDLSILSKLNLRHSFLYWKNESVFHTQRENYFEQIWQANNNVNFDLDFNLNIF